MAEWVDIPLSTDDSGDDTSIKRGFRTSNKALSKTVSDIEQGVPAAKAHWSGKELPNYNVPKTSFEALPGQKQSTAKWEDVPNTPKAKKSQSTKLTSNDTLNEIIGMGEAGLSVLSSITTGMAAGAVGGAQGILDSIRHGTFGTKAGLQEAENKFIEQSDIATYSPRTEEGKKWMERTGKVMENAVALTPVLPEINATLTARAIAKAKPRVAKAAQNTASSELDDILQKSSQKSTGPIPPENQMDLPFSTGPEEIAARRAKKSPQGDLFSDENIHKTDAQRKQHEELKAKRKDEEVTRAYEQRAEEQRQEAQRDAEIWKFVNGIDEGEAVKEPSQMGGSKSKVKPLGQTGFGKGQRGSIGWYSGKPKQERPTFESFDHKQAVQDAILRGITKEQLVQDVYKAEGRQAALDVLTEYNAHHATAAKSETAKINAISDKFQALRGADTSDTIKAQELYKALSDEAKSEEAYHAQPTEAGGKMSDTAAKEHAALDKELDAAYERAVKASGGKLPEELEQDYNPRVAQRTFADKVKSFGSGIIGGGGFGRKPGQMRNRNMIAVEGPDGKRQVVYREGNRLFQFENGKKSSTPFYQAEADTDLRVGNELDNGLKVVEATTKEIESQTPVKYTKDAAANKLNALLNLNRYAREAEFLKSVLPDLKKRGMVMSKDKVASPPNGYRSLNGNPLLENYWVQHRYANLFEDNMLGGGPVGSLERGLEIANSAAVGTMFWNPYPHIFNALDHYVNSIGFDFIQPWKWKSIAKSAYEAYHDVSTMSEDYHKYLKEGWGLQYGSTVARDGVMEAVSKIPASDLKGMAASWGMKPAEFIGALYENSRRVLWGGSDIFMIAARKHLASQKGMDIFNKALGNYVEAHNPNYRIPSNIGYDSLMKIPGMSDALAGATSRMLSKMMQSRAFNTFGRYHYGQFKSLSSNIHDMVLQNEHSVQTRSNAAKNLAFVGFNLGVVYPYVWDTIAHGVTGDPNAEQRRAGASTIPYIMWHVALQDKQVNDLLHEAIGLPPVTTSIVETLSNRQLFTGKHIWEPSDHPAGQAYDTAKYLAESTISPMRQIERAVDDWQKELASQAGIKLTRPKTEKAKKSIQRAERAAALRRQKQRGW